MSSDDIFMIWLGGGIALMLLEILVPGGIVFFLGLAAALVSLLLYLGVVDGWLQAFTAWFAGSLALLFGLRGIVQRIMPAQIGRGNTDEDLDAYGHQAHVCQRIPANGEGRITFRGSDWAAQNYHRDHDLDEGTEVRLVMRENLTWIVEAVDPSTTAASTKAAK